MLRGIGRPKRTNSRLGPDLSPTFRASKPVTNTDSRRHTGCTALLFEGKATAGVDYDGSAPGSHLGVLLQPVSPFDTIHGLLLTGGGPMGLAAVSRSPWIVSIGLTG